jgi:hypothetical protein
MLSAQSTNTVPEFGGCMVGRYAGYTAPLPVCLCGWKADFVRFFWVEF